MSRAFHTAKFELDNGRHFYALFTVNLVRFNKNDLVQLIRDHFIEGQKGQFLCNKAQVSRTNVISLYYILSFHEMKPPIWTHQK